MKHSIRSTIFLTTTIGMLLLSACGKKDEPISPNATPASAVSTPANNNQPIEKAQTSANPKATKPAPAAISTTTPATSKTVKLTSVVLGNALDADHAVSKSKTRFTSNERTLYASVRTQGSSKSMTLSAKWSYLQNKPMTVATTAQSIAPDGPAITTFSVHNPQDWPPGKYKVDIALNNKIMSTKYFVIKNR